MMTITEFAAACGCQPEDIAFLIQTQRLIVAGARIDPDLVWLARMKLQSIGRMTPGGEYIPAGQRQRRYRTPRRAAS